MRRVDLAVIGAGPAGLVATITAARHGASVVLFDEQQHPGGQIYRNLENNLRKISTQAGAKLGSILGEDYLAGESLLDQFRTLSSNLDYKPASVVWQVDPDGALSWSRAGQAERLTARHIIVATGAMERPVPVPGWTLPGVMTIGAAQILLKNAAILPSRAVLAGSGPLLYLFAKQMIQAESPPLALIETQSHADHFRALRFLPTALKGWTTLLKGLDLLKTIRQAGVSRYTSASQIYIRGGPALTHISFRQGAKRHEISCDHVFLHQGVVPNTQISRSLGLAHRWSERQRCFYPEHSCWGETKYDTISVAGDGAGIMGACAAALAGKKAALNALYKLGYLGLDERDNRAVEINQLLARERAPRAFLDTLYSPPAQVLRPDDPVLVCRCEEVTAGAIRGYADLGCVGPNQAKAFGRCGMGPCQGRYCGLTVTELLAQENKMQPVDVGYYRIRSPIKPITLGELASLSSDN